MAPRYMVETLPSGRRQFVLKRSHSHHAHGHHHHLPHLHFPHSDHDNEHHHHHKHKDYFKIPKEQYNSMIERERMLEDSNITLVSENVSLKSNLSAAEAERARLAALVAQLQRQVTVLCADNESLQRTVDQAGAHSSHHHRDLEKLQARVDKLDKDKKTLKEENADLKHRNKCLSEQLDEQRARGGEAYWKDLYWSFRSRYDSLSDRYTKLADKVRAYEDILIRNRYI
jgi:chromosome segregation ATPase